LFKGPSLDNSYNPKTREVYSYMIIVGEGVEDEDIKVNDIKVNDRMKTK